MSYLLLLTFSTLGIYAPKSFSITEFQSKIACEIALEKAKSFYRTKDDESYCISVADEVKKKHLKDELNKLKGD